MSVVVVHLTGDHGGVMPHYPLLLQIFTKESQKIVTLASTPQGARVQAHNHVLPLQGGGGQHHKQRLFIFNRLFFSILAYR